MPGSRGCCWNWACYCIAIASQRVRWIFAVEVFVFWLGFTMGSIRINLDRFHSEIKSKILDTKTLTAKTAWSAALIGPAIELSYGNPGERKRLQCNSKPNSNSNPAIQAFESWSAIAKPTKHILGESPLKVSSKKVTSEFPCCCLIWRRFNSSPFSDMAKPARRKEDGEVCL